VLECLGLSFACGRAEVDGDVMAARLVRFAFKAPAGAGRLHGRQLPPPYDVEIRFPTCIGGLARAMCLGPRTSRSRTCRVRRRLVVRGGGLSCEEETCHARRRLVGDAAVRLRTGCFASEGLDKDLHAFLETQHQVESALLLDVVISKGTAILKLLAN
jgi:hypothetical protein